MTKQAKKKVDFGNVPANWYNIMPSKYKNNSFNPNFNHHGIQIPARIGIIGFSGSGKTNTVMDLIYRFNGTFDKIVLCMPNSDEPLYNMLKDKFAGQDFTVYENGLIPSLDSLKDEDHPKAQSLVIFDDLITFKKIQSDIEQFFIRGRKIGGGITCVYISQNYYSIPKPIRSQFTHVILKKIGSVKDLTMILREISTDLNKEQLLRLYQKATENFLGFLMLDLSTTPDKRYRSGYFEIINPHDF